MALSTAVKAGGGILTSGVILPTSYLTYDKFFSLYEVEKKLLEENVVLKVEAHTPTPADSNTKHTYLKISKDGESKWECIVKAVASEDTPTTQGSQADLVNEIKGKILAENESNVSEEQKVEKKSNQKNLIKNCSKNRKSVTEEKIVSEITILLKKTSASNTEKWTFKDEKVGELFGKGFWI